MICFDASVKSGPDLSKRAAYPVEESNRMSGVSWRWSWLRSLACQCKCRRVLLALVLLTLAITWGVVRQITVLDRSRVYLIGYGDRPPMYVVTGDPANPSGFAVEVLKEAARREGIQLQWVPIGQKGVDKAFANRRVDLTPFTLVLAERKKKGVVFAEPWWSDNHVVVTEVGTGIRDRSSLVGRRVGFTSGLMKPPAGFFPEGIIPVQASDSRISMQQLCQGLVDAAVVQQSYFESVALERTPECAHAKLTQIGDLSFHFENAIASLPESAHVARALRRQIDNMVEDGTLSTIAGSWMPISSRQVNLARHLNRNLQRTSALEKLLLLLSVLILFGVREIVLTRKLRRTAERASVVKDEFLANMSHEFRTPMNAVLGLTQLTLEGKLEPESRQNLQLVYAAANNLRVMVDDLFDFGELAQNKLLLQSAPFNLRELTDSLIRGMAMDSAKKGIELLLDVSEDVPALVMGDENRVRQVLHNLLSNALKFTQTGEVSLTVKPFLAARESPGGESHTILFTIRDTGIGIARDNLSKIFKLFTQGDSSSTRQYGGTGLGLAVTDGLVRLMGGSIEVSSLPGAGTTFRVKCRFGAVPQQPRASTEELRMLHQAITSPVAADSPSAPGSPNILVVHRNATARLMICRQAEACGWSARSAGSVDAAMRAVHELGASFDAILIENELDDERRPLRQRLRSEWLEPGLILELHEAFPHATDHRSKVGDHVCGSAVCLVKPSFQDSLRRVLEHFSQATPRLIPLSLPSAVDAKEPSLLH
jgi:signal transduction histidine kinase